jgi:hypothetical protein
MTSRLGVQPWTITHDATTLGGNSGSIILLADREQLAAGLHYGGRGVELRENWGHVLASVLDSTDETSARTLRDVLQESGVQFNDGSTAPETTPARGTSTVQSPPPPSPTVPARGSLTNAKPPIPRNPSLARPRMRAEWRDGVTLEMMQSLAPVAGKSRLEAFLEAPGDGLTDSSEFEGREGYDLDFLEGFPISHFSSHAIGRYPQPAPGRNRRRAEI